MLAKILSVNTSTISTAKQRLNEKGMIKKKYVPEFFNIDSGLVIIASGKYRFQFPNDVRNTITGFVTHPATPFFMASDNISWLVMGLVPPKESDLLKEQTSTVNEQYINEMTFDINKIWFDTDNVKVWRYFDYGHLLCKTLNINIPAKINHNLSTWSFDELKKNEKIIIQSLLRDSQPSDFQRSQTINVSHPTITKLRKSLIKRGIVKSTIKPNLSDFGFSILAWFNIRLEGKVVEKKILSNLCSDPTIILCVNDKDNIFILSVFLNIRELLNGQQKINDFMSNTIISYENINFNYFSLDNSSFNVNLNPEPTTKMFASPSGEKKDMISEDTEQQLMNILKKYFALEEATSIITEVKKDLDLEPSKKVPSKTVLSMILELLTEPKYILPLNKNDRTSLQAVLIEKLNYLRALTDIQYRFGDSGKKNKVLIVEDSKVMVDLLKDIFSEADFDVVGAVDNGQGAFDRYKELCENDVKPDVVLMDIFVKGGNGIEATKRIMDYDPSACIVVFTSSLDSKIKTKLTSMGVDEYLIKPVTKIQLITTLEQSIAKRKGMMK
ncbi:MAG: response regulator [Thermoplasmata archaeon]|nr:MAG: response regulator [Thermoplasmata archaeon]